MAADRDRDGSGRPHSSRPRDELGRPLPREAADTAPGADAAGGPIGPGESAALGETLLLAGRPFQAHEVFEDAWKAAAGPERDLWRGLAQVAVGLTHARRGNARGAISLLRQGAAHLRDYASETGAISPYGIDVTYVAARADSLAARIDAGGLEEIPESAFLLSLDERGAGT